MKKLIFSLFAVSLFFSSQAQFVPDSIAKKQVSISLKGKYHAFIYSLMPDKGSSDAINYVNQVRAAFDTTFDTAKVITVVVSYAMVAQMYFTIGSQQERLSATDNAEIKDALIPQLYVPQYMDLLQIISDIGTINHNETEVIRNEGINKIMSIIKQ
jgi:hypothetical protein